MALVTQILLVSGGLNIVARHPGGAKGTRLNSRGPSKTWYADSWGWVRDVRSIFNLSCAYLVNLNHSTNGKFSSHVLRPAIVLFLEVCIARSNELTLWLCG